jgi:hypothetical protein
MGIAELVHHAQDLLAALGGSENHGYLDGLACLQGNTLPQAKNWIQDKPLVTAGFLEGPHRVGQRPAPADERPPIGLELQPFIPGMFKSKAVPADRSRTATFHPRDVQR